MSKTYREFLIESGVSAEELVKVEDTYMDRAIIESADPSAADVVLGIAFVWEGTPQGHEFWRKIANDLGGDF